MSDPRYKIVFDGQVISGIPLETAKENLSRLFKLDRSRVDALFGTPGIVLKRDLSEADVGKYLQALEQAGVQVRQEIDLASNLTLVEAEDQSSVDKPTMRCPKCGHEQPEAVGCVACGIIIEKYLARQAQQPEAPASTSPYAPPQAPVGDEDRAAVLKPFSLEGRIGRLRYMAWTLVIILATLPPLGLGAGLLALQDVLGILFIAAVLIAMTVAGIMTGVQRLHDIGWPGWLLLLNLIPLINNVFALLLLVLPGSEGSNRYGPPPPPNSVAVKVLAILWVLPILGIILFLIYTALSAAGLV